MRVFILDNHRPLHLANIYSKHSVVVFDDNYDAGEDDSDSLPSDGSELSGGISSSDSEGSSSDDDAEDEEDMFDEVPYASHVLLSLLIRLPQRIACFKSVLLFIFIHCLCVQELEAADIDAAFRNPAEGDEDAELEDDDNNGDEDDENNDGEEAEEVVEGAEEGSAEGSANEEADEEGEELGSDEERSVDSADSEGSVADDEQEGVEEGEEGEEGEADVTVEYNDLGEVVAGQPSRKGTTGKRKKTSKAHTSTSSGGKKGKKSPKRSRTSGDASPVAELDESAVEGWDAGNTQQERRRTRDLYSADDQEQEEEEDQEEHYRAQGQDEVEEEEEENMQIRGRKRRSAEAEEALRAKERRRHLQDYYARSKSCPCAAYAVGICMLWLSAHMFAQIEREYD